MDEAPRSQDLAEAIEHLMFHGLAPSPALRHLDIPFVTATLGPSRSHIHNRVGLASVPPTEIDGLIDTVQRTYRDQNRGWTWYVSPTSRPADIGPRLTARGLAHDPTTDLAGMALTPLPHAQPPEALTPAELRSVDLEEFSEHAHVIAEALGTDLDVTQATLSMYGAGAAPGYRLSYYLAFEAGAAVACGSSLTDQQRGVTLLGTGATLPACRGRGLYRAMVAARVADARRLGSRAVVAQALKNASAPILARLGFQEVITLERYISPAP